MSADREAYREYVGRQYADFLEHTGGSGYVWNTAALARVGRDESDPFAAWRGPWRNVRPYVTTEFRQWVEERSSSLQGRLTYSEWQAARIAERRAAAETERDYLESADYLTDRLAMWAEMHRERDELIVEARARGASFAELQAATGLSRMAIHNVIVRARDVEIAAAVETLESEWRVIDGELVEVF